MPTSNGGIGVRGSKMSAGSGSMHNGIGRQLDDGVPAPVAQLELQHEPPSGTLAPPCSAGNAAATFEATGPLPILCGAALRRRSVVAAPPRYGSTWQWCECAGGTDVPAGERDMVTQPADAQDAGARDRGRSRGSRARRAGRVAGEGVARRLRDHRPRGRPRAHRGRGRGHRPAARRSGGRQGDRDRTSATRRSADWSLWTCAGTRPSAPLLARFWRSPKVRTPGSSSSGWSGERASS